MTLYLSDSWYCWTLDGSALLLPFSLYQLILVIIDPDIVLLLLDTFDLLVVLLPCPTCLACLVLCRLF